MPAFQDSHPGNSDPLDEQTGVVNLINFLQEQPDWDSTAVIITYDDSDGWYDHAFARPTQGSFSTADALNGTGICGVLGSEPNGVKGMPGRRRFRVRQAERFAGRKPESNSSDPPPHGAVVGDGEARPRHIFRREPVVLRQDVLRLVSQS
jgi:hypothetical protein